MKFSLIQEILQWTGVEFTAFNLTELNVFSKRDFQDKPAQWTCVKRRYFHVAVASPRRCDTNGYNRLKYSHSNTFLPYLFIISKCM